MELLDPLADADSVFPVRCLQSDTYWRRTQNGPLLSLGTKGEIHYGQPQILPNRNTAVALYGGYMH